MRGERSLPSTYHQNELSPLLQPGPPLPFCCCVPINFVMKNGGPVLRNHKFIQLYSLLNFFILKYLNMKNWILFILSLWWEETGIVLRMWFGTQMSESTSIKMQLTTTINKLWKTIFPLTLIGSINVMQVWPNGNNIKSYEFSKSLWILALLQRSYSCLWLHSHFSGSCNTGCILNSYHKSMKKNIYRPCGR